MTPDSNGIEQSPTLEPSSSTEPSAIAAAPAMAPLAAAERLSPVEQSSTKVKVCGVTRLQDAELAVELGAWAVGMVLYEHSPRRCSPAEALRITGALRRRVELCGVFVNAPLEQVVGTAQELGLTLLQLHGDEGPAYCAEAAHRSGARIVKAVQVSTIGEVRAVERYHVDYHLFDARASTPGREALRGGTGESFDWSLLAARRSKVPLILSGGLRAENVAEAIARAASIGPRARPFAVDTASGTEAAPGRKDPRALREFFAQVQHAELGAAA
jgi:phosphoribosylanthranilate isomerase